MHEIELTNLEAEVFLTSKHLASLFDLNLPIKISYWLVRIRDKMKEETEQYFLEKKKLIEKHVSQKDGRYETIVKEGMQQFLFKSEEDETTYKNSIKILMEQRIKLPGIFYLDIDIDDPRLDSIGLTANHLILLGIIMNKP